MAAAAPGQWPPSLTSVPRVATPPADSRDCYRCRAIRSSSNSSRTPRPVPPPKVLSWGLITTASLSRIPQISNVLRAASAEGLSIASTETEMVANTLNVLHSVDAGRPFAAYGELAMLCLQYLVLLALIYRYAGQTSRGVGAAVAYAGAIGAWRVGLVPASWIKTGMDAGGVAFTLARVNQIVLGFRRGDVGVLSTTTAMTNVAGTAVRVWTQGLESPPAPTSLRLIYAVNLALNCVIVGQCLTLGNRKKGGKKGSKQDAAPVMPGARRSLRLSGRKDE